jgi:regulatory protein
VERDLQPRLVEVPPAAGGRPDDPAYARAMAAAGRLLAARPRTEYELRSRLEAIAAPPRVVDRVLARVAELGLVDDRAFARQWVEERSRRLGPAVLVSELQAKGVDRDVAEEAVAAAGLDEEAQARDLAARLVAKVAGRPLREQRFRLQTMLSRRGISEEAAAAGVRAVLPPEGWD